MRTWKSVARVGFDSSASESSDSESDGSSDTDTDTDSDTEEEDSGFLNRKPVRAKQKVSKKTTTKSRKAGAPIKMNKKEKNRKGSSTTIAKKQRAGAANKRNNKENKVGFDSSASESSSSEINDTNSESDGSSDTDTDTDSDTEEEDSGFLDRKPVRAKPKVFRKTTTERRKAGAPIKMNKKEKNGKEGSGTTIAKKQRPEATNKRNNNEKKASCKKVLTEKPATNKRKNGVSTTNTKKQKPEATNKTNHKEKKASPKKVPMEKAGANKRKNVTKEGRENEDGPKAKKRREALPKQCPLTSEESEESVNTSDDQDLVTQQPSTSGSGRPQFKQGTPSDDELEHLAVKLGGAWKKLGRRLGIKDPKLEETRQSNEALSEKGYQMLRHWKGINGSAATYQILGQALQNKLVNLRNLAEEFC